MPFAQPRSSARLIAIAGCAACVLGTAGCGNGEDEREIRAVVGEIRQAYLAEDYRGVCAHMSTSAQRQLGGMAHLQPTTCAADLAHSISAEVITPRKRVDPPIAEIDVEHDRATALALLGGTTPGRLRFVKEDGEWKLAKLYDTTGPPAPDL